MRHDGSCSRFFRHLKSVGSKSRAILSCVIINVIFLKTQPSRARSSVLLYDSCHSIVWCLLLYFFRPMDAVKSFKVYHISLGVLFVATRQCANKLPGSEKQNNSFYVIRLTITLCQNKAKKILEISVIDDIRALNF